MIVLLVFVEKKQHDNEHHQTVVMEIWFCVRFIVLVFYRILKIEMGSFTSPVKLHKWNA